MEEKNQMIKIPLQFFGESGKDNFEDDFDDDFDDYGYEDGDADDVSDDGDGETDNEDGDGVSNDEGSHDDESGAGSNHSDLIADLNALGFKGDNLEAIKASVKARREAKEKGDASEERRAAQSAGKSHIKGSKPQKGANGDGTGGVTERRVVGFAEKAGCTKEEARQTLAKHARMIQGG